MPSLLSVDYTLMMAQNVGPSGITQTEWEEENDAISAAIHRALDRIQSGEVGFAALPDDISGLERVHQVVKQQKEQTDSLLVLGIGGSSLGPRALTDALASPSDSSHVHYVDNADPDTLHQALQKLDPDRTCVNVVSKSGGTIETLANYLITRQWLEDHLGEDEARKRLVFTTDPHHGFLRKTGEAEQITMLPIPPEVGGRFSIFSSVGLFPAAFAGVDTGELLAGARSMLAPCMNTNPTQNPAAIASALHYLMDISKGRSNTVFWAYADSLRSAASWFAQLWGESLGKKANGKSVGPTPLPAVGATDQHSQLQLYMEGPDNKQIWFVELDTFAQPGKIPPLHPNAAETHYLGNSSLQALMHAERRATALALGNAGKPNATIHLKDGSAKSIGALLFFLQMQTAFVGELYGINPYDQPGVEAGKLFTYGLMNRPGFEEHKRLLEDAEKVHTHHEITVEENKNEASS